MTSWTLLGIILLVARDSDERVRPPCDAKRPPVQEHWRPCVLLASRGLYAVSSIAGISCVVKGRVSIFGTEGPHRRGAPARRRRGGAAGSAAEAARTREGAGGTASGPGPRPAAHPGGTQGGAEAPAPGRRPPAQDGGGPAARSRGPGKPKSAQQI